MDSSGPGDLRETPTLGVEEEFLLLDRKAYRPVGRGSQVLEAGRRRLPPEQLVPEISQAMVETVSGVCGTGAQLRGELVRLRGAAARAAGEAECLLLASGTSPLGRTGPGDEDDPPEVPPLREDPRYLRIRERFGPLVRDQGVCSCHVHVGMPDVGTAVAVVNHLRPWLPLLLALTANSPYWNGADTGYASWRTMLWRRWPTAGPPPVLRSAEHYEEVVRALVASGAALDPAMVYWYARPSRHVPTVEVRVADVLPTVAETVAYALVVRAMVVRARAAVRAGALPPRVEQDVLVAACWQAAREGVTGELLDLIGGSAPAATPVVRQIETARRLLGPHLPDLDERALVNAWLDRLTDEGGAADRQRALHRGTGRLDGLVEHLTLTDPGHAPETLADPGRAPETLADPGHAPETLAGPGRVPETLAGPGHAPETLAGPGHAPETLAGPGHAPETLAGPGRASETLAGPGRAPETLAGPGRAPEAARASLSRSALPASDPEEAT
ncbi:glutamate--cysteine ligase [Streptomyces sp. NPDC004629]|uniref:carboxylate-amine ligase n=1 Tax=Streptomyces sp. NPDC004629 TaxID=3364705 RepID=UPI0036B9C4FA